MENRTLLPTTEQLTHTQALDALDASAAATALLQGQLAAVAAVAGATAGIVRAAEAMAAAIRAGGRLVYAAAGSSGLMALADSSELAGTFGIPPDAVQIHMAGGVPVDGRMPGDTEDDVQDVDAIAKGVTQQDVVIVLSASGTTPYAVAIAERCKAQGATLVAMANNAGSRLLELADIAICIETPPEVIAGSTRMGAGSAQKVALNMMSSLMGVKLGHVYGGMMVNVVADNAKLVNRSIGMVRQISGVPEDTARAALELTDGRTKLATLVAAGCSLAQAKALLAQHDGHLGPCLDTLRSQQNARS
ncbi:N-acetylmuramic acid 6-phosphate etherase [Marivita sp. S2033]|uniref:N-acetylmuramic acid 6-phosphate etherase n=1 Tax=Marivita sp. S2033 TaxID=3373187 RepID=UPI0039828BC5